MSDYNRRIGFSAATFRRLGREAAKAAFDVAGSIFDEDGTPMAPPELPDEALVEIDRKAEADGGRPCSQAELDLACEAYEAEVYRIIGASSEWSSRSLQGRSPAESAPSNVAAPPAPAATTPRHARSRYPGRP